MTSRFKRPIWIVPLVIAGLVAAVGWWGNGRLRETIEEQLSAALATTLNANVTALEIWTTNQTRLVRLLADDPQVRSLALRIFERAGEAANEGRRPVDLPDMESFTTYLRPRLNQLGYGMAQLVDTNFILVATSQRGRPPIVGQPISEAHTNKFLELFTSEQPVLITPFKPEFPARRGGPWSGRANENDRRFGFGNRPPPRGRGTNDPSRRRDDISFMQVAAPVRDPGGVRGALALIINPTNEFTRILSVARSGETGETYAFDQTGLLISQSRFDNQLRQLGLLAATNSSSALNLRLHDPGGDLTTGFQPAETNRANQALIHLVQDAVEGGEGSDVTPSRDYRGIPVVGAWRWLPKLGFGVATQIDAREAYRPLRVLQLIFISLFLLLMLSSVIMFVFSYANVIWRRRLGEAESKLKQLGQYTLEEKIGEGGMGVVYRARHALLRRDTAVKLLSQDQANANAIERFEREVRLTCQLTHPNTIQVYDYGHTPEGTFYYAMEYLRGLNLHQLVARFGPQPEGRVVHILTQVCDSLAEAHSAGLVHRDIKPANVFLCERGGVPDCVKVLDFGLVREFSGPGRADMHLTSEMEFVGTPWFMAPEAIKDSSKSDPRSDLYALGALGYYLLTGRYVYEAKSVMEIYEKQLTTPVQSPALHAPGLISPQVEKALLRCLDKEPDQRPQSAGDLRRLLQSSPLLAEWQPDARAMWWAEHRREVQVVADNDAAGTSSVPTVKIDFATRMK
jgi:eukaryotic-like serine/threonine-protein kinase